MVDPPKKHPGERLASYFDSFFKTIVGVSTFGASVTFTKIISTPVTPWIDYGYSKDTIQNYLAISWLLFILDLAVTSFAASALSLYQPQVNGTPNQPIPREDGGLNLKMVAKNP
jgi:hypothetical protein